MLTVIAAPGSVTGQIGRLVAERCGDLAAPAAMVDALPPARLAPLDDLTDADLEAGLIAPLAALAETLAGLVPGHRRIVLIGTAAGLGQWNASLAGAFAAGATGLMRSVALEFMREGVTINLLALGADGDEDARQAVPLAIALLQSGGMSGQVLACDGGDNLRMRHARKPG